MVDSRFSKIGRCRAPLLLAVLLFIFFPAFAPAASTQIGDLDGDGLVNVYDLTRLRAHIRGTQALPDKLKPFADVNNDGFINEDDAVALINIIVGKDPAKELPLASIRETSPFAGESGVSLTREVIVRFTMPLSETATLTTWDANKQTPGNFYAEAGGRKLLTRAQLSGDRLKATLFFLEDVPASTRVTVTFDADPTGRDWLGDLLERPVDPDGDGTMGGKLVFTYDTAPITPVPGTGIIGHVYASEKAAGGGDMPLEHVLVRVVGSEDLQTFTAADGSFSLNPCPTGRFFVEVDGRTSTLSDFPDGGYYPYINKPWEAQPGRTDNLAAGTGKIYLPLVAAGTLQPVSADKTTTIAFPASVVAAHPELAGVEIYVPPDSLFADNGNTGGKVGIAPVASDRLPEPLPPGLHHALDISIQTDGATNFDRPVPVKFPNLPDPVTGVKLKPGEKSALWSFNHDKGAWEIVGPMTVTDDGNFLVTDVGVGVRQPGWHGAQPGCQVNGPPPRPDCEPEAATLAKAEADLAKALKDLEKVVEDVNPLSVLTDEAYDEAEKGTFKLLDVRKADGKLLFDGRSSFRYKNIHFKKYLKGVGKVLKFQDLAVHGAGCIQGLADDITIANLASADCQNAFTDAAFEGVGFWAKRGLDAARLWAQNGRVLLYQHDAEAAFSAYKACLAASSARSASTLSFRRTFSVASVEDPLEQARDVMVQAADIASDIAQTQLPIWTDLNTQISAAQPIAQKIAAWNANHSLAAPTIKELKTLLASMNAVVADQTQLFKTPPIDLISGLNLAAIDDFFSTASELNQNSESQTSSRDQCLCVLEGSDGNDQRFLTDIGGTFSRNLTPNTFYHVVMFNPAKQWIGETSFLSDDNGGSRVTPTIVMGRDHGIDTDSDGLSDDAEHVYGTDPSNPDTDGDGIPDGAEIQNGTNPLDNKPAATGILTTINTPGQGKDIAAQNTVALLADGSEGVSVFNVANALNPVRTAQVRLTGSTEAVALDGTLAAATGSSLSLLDLSDLSTVRVTKQLFLGGTPRAVTAAGGVAYTGLDNGQVVAVDMAAGAELERLQVSTEPIHDLSFAGDVLYARSAGHVYAIDMATEGMTVAGSVAVPGNSVATRYRLFAGGGLAYAPVGSGYVILSLADPLHPTIQQTITTQQNGWRQIVPTGSGLGVAAMGITPVGDSDLNLYDLGSTGTNSQFLTTFATPGLAEAVSIYNGLAYVADGDAGLTVVNYKAYDALGVPPTISIGTGFSTVSGALQAEEGKLGRVTAQVADDVQVRNVEFYLDGQLTVTDGNFPFEYRFTTPLLATGKTSFTLRAKATDTGGNSTWSDTLTVNLVKDATPPRVVKFIPPTGSLTGSIQSVAAVFSEPMDQATLNATTLALVASGPDGAFGTDDDVVPAGGVISYREATNAAFITFPTDLAPGNYQLTVKAPAADLAGNPLATTAQTQFRVFSFKDTDGDGVPDDVEASLGLDPNNPDTDGNGIRDGDEDYDHDGLSNAAEIALGLDPKNAHSNGDPTVLDGDADPDKDGLSNKREAKAGTDANKADTDGDGWNDETEVTGGSNPLDPKSRPLGLVAAGPSTSFLRLGDTSNLLASASVMAQPGVYLVRTFPRFNEVGSNLGPAAFVATPTVFTTRRVSDSSGSSGSTGSASVVATPTVYLARPTANPSGANGTLGSGSFIASPSINILSLGAPVFFLAQPPVSVKIQTQ